VAVFGCGGIGLSAVNGAAIAGADRIIAIDTISSKLETAKEMGATDIINASNVDPVETIKELTGGGAEYAFEAVGLKFASGRHRHDYRDGAIRHEDRIACVRFPAREKNPRFLDGQQPVPCGHATSVECLEKRPSET
jgi:threonine dehydrogenase-like Zn-dependent dehydrogenase